MNRMIATITAIAAVAAANAAGLLPDGEAELIAEQKGSSMYCVKGESEKALHGSESGY